jgi:hypothetical protein
MKRLVPNAVPITSPNYEEITLSEELIKINTDDTITGENILALKSNIEIRLGSKLQEMGWNLGIGQNKIVIFKLDFDKMKVKASLQLNSNLSFSIYHINASVISSFKAVDSVKTYTDIDKIIVYLNNTSTTQKTCDFIKIIKEQIEEFRNFCETDNSFDFEEKIQQLLFFSEQIELIFSNKKNYSVNTLLKSFIIYIQSSAVYDSIRENKFLSPRHLKRLKSGFNISPTPDKENATFLKSMASKMTDLEKYVVLQLDEIYVNSSMQYRGGKLYGIAENQNSSTQEAKTIQAFLISSAFGNFKSVVSLTPVKNLVGEELYELTQKKILHLLCPVV